MSSDFNARDFLPKPHVQHGSSHQSMRSTSSRLSMGGSKLGLKRTSINASQATQTLLTNFSVKPSEPKLNLNRTANGGFLAPKDPDKAASKNLAVQPSTSKENAISPVVSSQSPLPSPAKVPRLSTDDKVVKPLQRAHLVSFSILEEDPNDDSWSFTFKKNPKKSDMSPKGKSSKVKSPKGKSSKGKSSKSKSPKRKTGPSPAKSTKSSLLTEFDSSQGFCPFCQVPLACIKITKMNHANLCHVSQDNPECPDGIECTSTSRQHFQDNKHTELARKRAEDDKNSDIEIVEHSVQVPQFRTPVQGKLQPMFECEETPEPPEETKVKNPFLESDEESGDDDDDPFKEYEDMMDNNNDKYKRASAESGIQENGHTEMPHVPDNTENEEPSNVEQVPQCIEGLCDAKKVSVSVEENGVTKRVFAHGKNGWEVEEKENNDDISHALCGCGRNLHLKISCPQSKIEQQDQWASLMGRMQKKSSSPASTTSSSSNSSTSSFEKSVKKCPNFKLIVDTKFSVDAFNYGNIPGVKFSFLTHFHYDHYIGLTRKFTGHIYCSAITGRLVKQEFKLTSSQLKILELDEPIMIDQVKVTALDANHCPGSIMLLFELLDGRKIFHTGDFRYCPAMESYPSFWNLHIKILHLDTTYCNEKYNFPPQDEVVSLVGDLAERKMMENEKCLFVCGSYTIGKEKVFMEIAKRLNLTFWTDGKKKRILKLLQDPQIDAHLDETGDKAKIHVLMMGKINFEHLHAYLDKVNSKGKKFTEIVAFRPSGWQFNDNTETKYNEDTRGNVTIYSLPYSEHSSFQELKRFVKFLRPDIVKPTVASKGRNWAAMTAECKNWVKEANADHLKQSELRSSLNL